MFFSLLHRVDVSVVKSSAEFNTPVIMLFQAETRCMADGKTATDIPISTQYSSSYKKHTI